MILGNRRGYFYREELADHLDLTERMPGRVQEGAFFLSPPFVELTLADGLWAKINSELGTLFDFAEEEVVDPEQGKRLATVISKFARDHYTGRNDSVRRQIGTLNGEPEFAEMPSSVLSDVLKKLVAFIDDEAAAGHTIVGAM